MNAIALKLHSERRKMPPTHKIRTNVPSIKAKIKRTAGSSSVFAEHRACHIEEKFLTSVYKGVSSAALRGSSGMCFFWRYIPTSSSYYDALQRRFTRTLYAVTLSVLLFLQLCSKRHSLICPSS